MLERTHVAGGVDLDQEAGQALGELVGGGVGVDQVKLHVACGGRGERGRVREGKGPSAGRGARDSRTQGPFPAGTTHRWCSRRQRRCRPGPAGRWPVRPRGAATPCCCERLTQTCEQWAGGCGWLMRGGGQRRPRWGRSATGRTNNLLGIQRPPIAHDQDCTRQADAPGGRGGEQSGGGWECVCSLGWRRDAAGCWVCWLCASGKRGSQERQRMNAGSERGEFTKALGRGQAAPARGRWPGRAGGLQDPGLQRPPTSALRSWGHWPKRGEGAHSPIGRHVPHWVSA